MIDTTSRRDRRAEQTRNRLAALMNQAGAPADNADPVPGPEWVDVSAEPPEPPPRDPWWRRNPVGHIFASWAPDAGRRRTVAMVLIGGLVLAVLIMIGVAVSSSGTEHEAPPVLPIAAATESTPASASIVVSVVGRVARPGLVTLSEGARVADALRETGGLLAGVDPGPLNLARRLTDGEQIYVGVPTPAGAEPVGGTPGAPGAPDKVDLNAASLSTLDTLPGVGPVTAQRIVDWRTEHGRFTSVDQLREIDGIGPGKYAKLKDQVVAR